MSQENVIKFFGCNTPVVFKVVNIDPQGSIGPSQESITSHGVEWGSMNNCWSLLEE